MVSSLFMIEKRIGIRNELRLRPNCFREVLIVIGQTVRLAWLLKVVPVAMIVHLDQRVSVRVS